jgi:hypothetical protein
MVFVESTDLDD